MVVTDWRYCTQSILDDNCHDTRSQQITTGIYICSAQYTSFSAPREADSLVSLSGCYYSHIYFIYGISSILAAYVSADSRFRSIDEDATPLHCYHLLAYFAGFTITSTSIRSPPSVTPRKPPLSAASFHFSLLLMLFGYRRIDAASAIGQMSRRWWCWCHAAVIGFSLILLIKRALKQKAFMLHSSFYWQLFCWSMGRFLSISIIKRREAWRSSLFSFSILIFLAVMII